MNKREEYPVKEGQIFAFVLIVHHGLTLQWHFVKACNKTVGVAKAGTALALGSLHDVRVLLVVRRGLGCSLGFTFVLAAAVVQRGKARTEHCPALCCETDRFIKF